MTDSPVRPWHLVGRERLFDHPLFELEMQTLRAENGDERAALGLHPPDWVNMIPLLDDGRILFVRQWRFGIQQPTLEIPGGMVEEGEEPAETAARELLEETGYRATRWTCIGSVAPNPAFQSNRCTTWLARDLERLGDPEGDGQEEIEVAFLHRDEIADRILDGTICHSLVVAAFYLLAQHERS